MNVFVSLYGYFDTYWYHLMSGKVFQYKNANSTIAASQLFQCWLTKLSTAINTNSSWIDHW